MSTEDQQAQEDELLALTSIYPEEEFKRTDAASGGEIILCLDLLSDFVVSVKSNSATNSFADNFEDTVSFLPPIVLNFDLPPGYPSTTPPNFTLSCKWLSSTQLTLLCQRLDDLWEENKGYVVLFSWIQFLKEETLGYLNIKSPYEIDVSSNGLHNQAQTPGKTCADGDLSERGSFDKRAIQAVQSVPALIRSIVDFNEAQQKKVFDSKPFLCNICFSEKLGSECTHFKACQHVYCNNCLKDYFEVQIKDGKVHALNCPEPECKSIATPAQVKDLVEEQLFSRYDRLLFQSSLDSMTDIVYCPRSSCQAPVMKEPEGTMALCTVCQYAFCIHCKLSFHGLSPCRIPPEKLAEVCEEYLAADEEGRRQMEKRYGPLKRVAIESKDINYLKENSKLCPGCRTPTEKISGCNKMICIGCNKFFCWLCLEILPQDDPYKHFNTPTGCLSN